MVSKLYLKKNYFILDCSRQTYVKNTIWGISQCCQIICGNSNRHDPSGRWWTGLRAPACSCNNASRAFQLLWSSCPDSWNTCPGSIWRKCRRNTAPSPRGCYLTTASVCSAAAGDLCCAAGTGSSCWSPARGGCCRRRTRPPSSRPMHNAFDEGSIHYEGKWEGSRP